MCEGSGGENDGGGGAAVCLFACPFVPTIRLCARKEKCIKSMDGKVKSMDCKVDKLAAEMSELKELMKALVDSNNV